MKETIGNIEAVIFDMGRVLVNIDNRVLVEKLFKGFKAEDIQELAHKTMHDPVMIKFNTGRMEPDEFARRMCGQFGLDLDFEAFKTLWCEIFYTMEGMEELVRRVRQQTTVGLLSDTDPVHWGFIRKRWPWIGAIANPTLSYEVGVMKPNAAIYAAAARNVGVPIEQCLFVDDLQTNVDGARAAGMPAIRFKSAARLEQQLRNIIG